MSNMDNHLQRKEVREAIANGSGYDIKRVSGMNGEKYFYLLSVDVGRVSCQTVVTVIKVL